VFDQPPALGGSEAFDLWSPAVGDTFRVFIGHCVADPRATIVVTDGNGLFGLVVDAVRMMQIPQLLPPLLVVGLGYPGARTESDATELRNRDLTPTAWPPIPGSGGADRFLSFIRRVRRHADTGIQAGALSPQVRERRNRQRSRQRLRQVPPRHTNSTDVVAIGPRATPLNGLERPRTRDRRAMEPPRRRKRRPRRPPATL
jgi:hypothetical protein